jgi:hypothetical protein
VIIAEAFHTPLSFSLASQIFPHPINDHCHLLISNSKKLAPIKKLAIVGINE